MAVASSADELLSSALAGSGLGELASAFGGPALQRVRSQAASLVRRGFRLEERSVTRTFVSWDPVVLSVVLQVEAQDRLVTPDAPDPEWSATVRQVWSRLQLVAGGWRVVETRDLSPDRWQAA